MVKVLDPNNKNLCKLTAQAPMSRGTTECCIAAKVV